MTGEEDVWLGRLDKTNYLYSMFIPLARFDGARWEPLPEAQRRGSFTRGVVYGERQQGTTIRTGTYWTFKCRRPESGSDRWTAEAPGRALPMLNLSHKSMAVARRTLCETGVKLPENNGNSAIVLLAEGFCAVLKFELRQGAWHAKLPSDGGVELRRSDPRWLEIEREGKHSFLPHDPPSEVVTRVTWVSDSDFLVSVVDRYQAALSGYLKMLRDTDAPVRRLHRALKEGHLGGGSGDDLQIMVERLRIEWPDAARSLQAVESMTSLLIETDEGQHLLKASVESRAHQLSASIEAKLSTDVSKRLEEREQEVRKLEEQVNTLRSATAKVNAELQEARNAYETVLADTVKAEEERRTARELTDEGRRQLDEVASALSTTLRERDEAEQSKDRIFAIQKSLQERLDSFIDHARREFEASGAAEHETTSALASNLLSHLNESGFSAKPFLPSPIPPWAVPGRMNATPLEMRDLKARLDEEARRCGINGEDLLTLDAFLRAGEPVFLAGPLVDLCLNAYARVVTAGEARVHALDPASIGLNDLWSIPHSGRPTSLSLAWNFAAANPHEFTLLCLRDVDAAPLRSWLTSLRAVLAGKHRPSNLLVVLTASESSPTDSEELPAPTDPLRQLAALSPRVAANAARSDLVLETQEPMATRLVVGAPAQPSREDHSAVAAKTEWSAPMVLRALRVSAVGSETGDHAARRTAAAWSAYLNELDTSQLSQAFKAGLSVLATMRPSR